MSRIKNIRLKKTKKERLQEGVNHQEISFLYDAFASGSNGGKQVVDIPKRLLIKRDSKR